MRPSMFGCDGSQAGYALLTIECIGYKHDLARVWERQSVYCPGIGGHLVCIFTRNPMIVGRCKCGPPIVEICVVIEG